MRSTWAVPDRSPLDYSVLPASAKMLSTTTLPHIPLLTKSMDVSQFGPSSLLNLCCVVVLANCRLPNYFNQALLSLPSVECRYIPRNFTTRCRLKFFISDPYRKLILSHITEFLRLSLPSVVTSILYRFRWYLPLSLLEFSLVSVIRSRIPSLPTISFHNSKYREQCLSFLHNLDRYCTFTGPIFPTVDAFPHFHFVLQKRTDSNIWDFIAFDYDCVFASICVHWLGLV